LELPEQHFARAQLHQNDADPWGFVLLQLCNIFHRWFEYGVEFVITFISNLPEITSTTST
jgi:hypothetical protein